MGCPGLWLILRDRFGLVNPANASIETKRRCVHLDAPERWPSGRRLVGGLHDLHYVVWRHGILGELLEKPSNDAAHQRDSRPTRRTSRSRWMTFSLVVVVCERPKALSPGRWVAGGSLPRSPSEQQEGWIGPSMRRPIRVKSFCSFRDFVFFFGSAKPPLSPPFLGAPPKIKLSLLALLGRLAHAGGRP
jgi:hypothetical protein